MFLCLNLGTKYLTWHNHIRFQYNTSEIFVVNYFYSSIGIMRNAYQ